MPGRFLSELVGVTVTSFPTSTEQENSPASEETLHGYITPGALKTISQFRRFLRVKKYFFFYAEVWETGTRGSRNISVTLGTVCRERTPGKTHEALEGATPGARNCVNYSSPHRAACV